MSKTSAWVIAEQEKLSLDPSATDPYDFDVCLAALYLIAAQGDDRSSTLARGALAVINPSLHPEWAGDVGRLPGPGEFFGAIPKPQPRGEATR